MCSTVATTCDRISTVFSGVTNPVIASISGTSLLTAKTLLISTVRSDFPFVSLALFFAATDKYHHPLAITPKVRSNTIMDRRFEFTDTFDSCLFCLDPGFLGTERRRVVRIFYRDFLLARRLNT